MSKEMLVIILGLWTIIVTQLGVPYHPWGVFLFILTGVAVAVTGFLLRGEALSRAPGAHQARHATFVESTAAESHENKEDINSFN